IADRGKRQRRRRENDLRGDRRDRDGDRDELRRAAGIVMNVDLAHVLAGGKLGGIDEYLEIAVARTRIRCGRDLQRVVVDGPRGCRVGGGNENRLRGWTGAATDGTE